MRQIFFIAIYLTLQGCSTTSLHKNQTLGEKALKTTCTPDNCVNNYVRQQIHDFQRWVIDEENDEPLYFTTEFIHWLPTIFSDTTITFSNGVLKGLYPRLSLSSISSSILSGYQYVTISSNGVILSGDYSLSGSVLGNAIDSSGRFEISCSISITSYVYYKLNSTGLLQVTSNSISASWGVQGLPSFENFMASTDPVRPILTKYFADNILASFGAQLRTHTTKFKDYMGAAFEGKSLASLSEWEDTPNPLPTIQPITTTTERPQFSCLPDACMRTYYTNELRVLRQYAASNDLQQIPLSGTFFNRTLTTVFDLDIAYRDITVDNFLDTGTRSIFITNDWARGALTFEWYPEVLISGSYAANGTILGTPTSQSGRWSGKIRERFLTNYKYSLSDDFEVVSVTTPTISTSTGYTVASDFSTDLFPTLHPLKQPFEELVQTQLSTVYRNTWLREFLPYMGNYTNEILSVATFEQFITLQLPSVTPTIPASTTPVTIRPTTLPPPFQCEPDTCLVDYVKLKFSRFSDWVDSANRDPLILPGSHRVNFALWDIDLYLENITVYGYLPTFLNAQTTISSNCLSGTLVLSTRSPSLRILGKYNSSGSLEGESLTGSGDWSMNLTITSTLSLSYRIDSEGFISEIRDTFTTSLNSRTGVVFEDFIDPSAPLAGLLLNDIAARASTLVATQIQTFTSLITDFMRILLTENKFYDIIVWHRYNNQTTEPPVICSKNSKSTISISNWYVPIFGHVPLTIQGSRLDILKSMECRFHDINTTSVAATIKDRSTAECQVPYLYQTGRIPVEIIQTYPNGCEQTFDEVIFSAKPDDINCILTADVAADGKLELSWNPFCIPSSSPLELKVAELNRDQSTWEHKGILIHGLDNTGIYSDYPSDDTFILKSLASGFILSLDNTNGFSIHSDVLYTDYGKTTGYFVEACQAWHDSELSAPPSDILEPCPPLLSQAWIDFRFEYEWELQDYETLQFFHPEAQHSFRQLIPNSDGAGSQCVYKNDLLLIGSPSGGSSDVASVNNRTGFISHHVLDLYPWYICCKFSYHPDSCRLYYERRPSDDGTGYIPPPRPGNAEGDPHMTTFDGVSYTFNGVGEFFMIRTIADLEKNFEMQGRMEQFIELSSGEIKNASAFTSFAFREQDSKSNETLVRLQISVAEDGNGILLLVNQTLLEIPTDFNFKMGKPFVSQIQTGGSLAIFTNQEGNTIQSAVVRFSTGFGFNVSAISGARALNLISFPSEGLKGLGYNGLLGSFDGVTENDLTFPGENELPLNSSLRDIHYGFGLKWRTNASQSIFTYDFGKTHASYQQPSFVPTFDQPTFEEYPEAVEICGESKDCLFDLVSTGSADFAKETKQFLDDFEETGEIIDSPVVMCRPLETPENGWVSVDNYISGSVATFYCSSGFEVSGNDSIVCGEDGLWDSAEPICVPEQNFDCSEKPDGYYANSEDCSKYYGCLNGVLREYTCPSPMRFDSIRLTCVPANSAVCA